MTDSILRIYKEGPVKLCAGCGRFMAIDEDREFLPHKKSYTSDEWCVPETPGPGHEWGLIGDSLIIFNELYAGDEVNVLAGTLAFSIRPIIEMGLQTFQIRVNGRRRKWQILSRQQVANWVQGLELDRSDK